MYFFNREGISAKYDFEKFFSTLSYHGSRVCVTDQLASKCLIMIREDDFRPMVAVAHTIWSDGKRTSGVIYRQERSVVRCAVAHRPSLSRSRDREIAIERRTCVEDLPRHVSDKVNLSNSMRHKKLLGFYSFYN